MQEFRRPEFETKASFRPANALHISAVGHGGFGIATVTSHYFSGTPVPFQKKKKKTKILR
jgi:hypothetical protein